VGLLVLCWAGRAGAQEALLALAAGQTRDAAGTARRGLTLSPALLWSGRRGSAQVAGHGSVLQDESLLGGADAALQAELLRGGPLATVIEAGGEILAGAAVRSASARLAPRLRLATRRWGVEAGPYLAGGATAVSSGPAVHDLFGRAVPAEGARWVGRSASGLGAAGWTTAGPLALRGEWRTLRAGSAGWEEWSASVGADLGRAGSVAVEAGTRSGAAAGPWWSAGAELPLGTGVAITAVAGRAAADPLTGRSGAAFGSVGLSLRAGHSPAHRIAPTPAPVRGAWTLRARARPGARVEVAGDWNGWRPQPLAETSPGEFRITLPLGPGLYRFLLRVDGAWRTPRGYATEPDEFGGRRALVRVETQ
jgi:hypothetical protein